MIPSKLEKGINILKNRASKYLPEIYGRLDHDFELYLYNAVRWRSCRKEPETTRWIESFDKNDVVYDIGASVGPYSLLMSKYAKEVYAFEPALFNFELLSRNIIYNYKKGLIQNNICPVNLALYKETKIGSFNYQSLEDGSSYHTLESNVNPNGEFEPLLKLPIPSMTLDQFISIFNAPIPTHIKIDVDGNELDILLGMKETLANSKLESILIEIDKKHTEKLVKLICDNGFSIDYVNTSKFETGGENHIFKRVKE